MDKGLKHKKWIERALFEQEKQFEIARKLRKLSSLAESIAKNAENARLSVEDQKVFSQFMTQYDALYGLLNIKLNYDCGFLGDTAEETNALFERALLGKSPRKNKAKA